MVNSSTMELSDREILLKLEIMHSGQIVLLWNFSGSTSVQLNRKSVADKLWFN